MSSLNVITWLPLLSGVKSDDLRVDRGSIALHCVFCRVEWTPVRPSRR